MTEPIMSTKATTNRTTSRITMGQETCLHNKTGASGVSHWQVFPAVQPYGGLPMKHRALLLVTALLVAGSTAAMAQAPGGGGQNRGAQRMQALLQGITLTP